MEDRELVARVERLVDDLDDRQLEAVRALLDLYGEGLRRIVERVAECDDGTLAATFSGDELVSHLLLLHGLHPLPLEQRVREALDGVRPYLESHGGDVELLSLDDGIARLRLQGTCNGCPSSAVTLKSAIEEAIWQSAPDVAAIEAEGVPAPQPQLLQIEPLRYCPAGEA